MAASRKVVPPAYFFLLLLALVVAHFLFPIAQIILFPYRWIGAAFIAFGIVMNLWTAALFKREGTTIKPYEMPTVFVASGPFRISRNPIYLGMAAILFGVAILFGSLVTFLFPIIFIILIQTSVMPLEEQNLMQAFGQPYRDYQRRVRRWI